MLSKKIKIIRKKVSMFQITVNVKILQFETHMLFEIIYLVGTAPRLTNVICEVVAVQLYGPTPYQYR